LILDFAGIISNIASFLLSFFLLFFIIFFLLKDHLKLMKFVNELFPLPRKKVDILIQKLESSINGVIRGDFLIALLQGVVAAVGFIVTGVPQPILWTIATIISSFVPTIGTSLVIIPAIFYLLFFKSLTAAIILAVWYLIAHLSVDNIIAPKIIGQQTQMHPLLVLLSILGGLEVFGVMGFLFGPIIMAIFIAILDAYRTGNVKS
jgi:predicted PurR-regulated permease PerM